MSYESMLSFPHTTLEHLRPCFRRGKEVADMPEARGSGLVRRLVTAQAGGR